MTFECPKCKSPVAREGQHFCYRCGHELNAYYDSQKLMVNPSDPSDPPSYATLSPDAPAEAPPRAPKLPASTVVLEAHAFDAPGQPPPATPQTASLKILLPTGDVFDREITNPEIQIGKGPRNDIVIADPAVSSAHALLRLDGGVYTIKDIGSRNGTFINGERITDTRQLNHGDVVGIGLSKLTFRMNDYSETAAIDLADIALATKPALPPPLTEESLADAVVAAGLAEKADVDRLRGNQKGRRLYRALIEDRLTSEEGMRDLMSRTFQIPVVDLNSTQIDEAVVAEFSARLALEHQVFAVARQADSIILAVADPTDTDAAQLVRREVSSPLSIRLATATSIRMKVDQHYAPKLIGVLPSGEKLEYLIDKKEVGIGKAGHNQVTLPDPAVSNTHAIVTAREAGYTIVDLGSRNGTFVNGERLGSQAHPLRHGDKVQLGQTMLTFRNPGETSANATAVLSGEALEEVRRRAVVADATPEERDRGAAFLSPEGALQAAGPGSVSAPDVLAPPPPGADAVAPVDAAAGDDKGEEKKRKKKRKKEKDARLRAAYVSAAGRVFAAVLSVALTVALTLYLTRSGSSPNKEAVKVSKKGHAKLKLPKPSAGTPFQDAAFEASGVVQVPDSNGVLFVDDTKLDAILWMQIDESGKQTGAVKAIPLGASVGDMEGITYGDGYFYASGSQSDPNYGDQNAIVRFKFDAGSQTITSREVIPNLRDFLLAKVSELKGEGEKKGKDGGLNIEGLAWDPKHRRLLLGLRSPQLNANAMIVPIALQDPSGLFSISNLKVDEAHPIQLPLEGLGIRDIQFDTRLDSFLIISGAPEHHEKKLGFKLWQWNGVPAASESDSGLRALTDLESAMKPEGVTHFEFGGRDFIFIVGDAGTYTKLDYTETE
jgi:pSer/pThr/pTyr-binding forkhead associated (FHA) protein